MTSPTRLEQQQWSTILELSTRMLEQAETRDWQALEGLMTARDRLLKLYFTPDAPASRSEALREQIAMIQENDHLIVELTKKNRELLEDELIRLKQARQVVSSYQQKLQRVQQE
ncbi:MAG: flagellar protein FliT [Pseudomonadales bacterium]|nr:flagellar protein FliT [Pseudomonadales bacterium]